MQLHRPSCLLLLQTVDRLPCLLRRHFWEVTVSFYHLCSFIAVLTDFRVILLPPAPKLSALTPVVRKEATSTTVEDGGLVKVLQLYWSEEAAHGVTTHKTWGPGMPSIAQWISKIMGRLVPFHKGPCQGLRRGRKLRTMCQSTIEPALVAEKA